MNSEELKKNITINLKQVERQMGNWHQLNSYGKQKESETMALESQLTEKIDLILKQLTELQRYENEIPTLSEFVSLNKGKVILWTNAITAAQGKRNISLDDEEDSDVASSVMSSSTKGTKGVYAPEEERRERQAKLDAKKDEEMQALDDVHVVITDLKGIAASANDAVKGQNEFLADHINPGATDVHNRLEAQNKMIERLNKALREKKTWVILVLMCIVFVILVIVAFTVN